MGPLECGLCGLRHYGTCSEVVESPPDMEVLSGSASVVWSESTNTRIVELELEVESLRPDAEKWRSRVAYQREYMRTRRVK